jgi:hypothetical protein
MATVFAGIATSEGSDGSSGVAVLRVMSVQQIIKQKKG